jgi:hypothetical protein
MLQHEIASSLRLRLPLPVALLWVMPLIAGAILFSVAHVGASGPSCTVDKNGGAGVDYTAIQSALDDIACATINIHPGLYQENLTISRTVSLFGVGSQVTIVDGASSGRVLQVISASVVISGMTFQNGMAPGCDSLESGGGIYNTGMLSLINSKVQENRTPYCTVQYGGGMANIGVMTITASTILTNSAPEGGGIANYGSLLVTGSKIAHNRADACDSAATGGGAIYTDIGSSTVVSDTQILDNEACSGGGIYSAGEFELVQSEVAYNRVTRRCGGVVATNAMRVKQSRIHENTSDAMSAIGGGICFDGRPGSELIVQQSSILSNTAGVEGGGLYASGAGVNVNVTMSLFQGNTSGVTDTTSAGGAGVSLDFESGGPSTVTFDHNVVAGNINRGAYASGGGLAISGSSITLTNNIIVGNRGWGIGLIGSANPGNFQIGNNTIYGNHGTGISFGSWSEMEVMLFNNIVAYNDNYGLELPQPWSQHVAIIANALWGNGQGDYHGMDDQKEVNGNLSAPPMLADPDHGDWHLLGCSGLVDKGISADAPPTDFYGNSRPFNGHWDIGASEFTGDRVCQPLFLPLIQRRYPIYIPPGIYPANKCAEKKMYADMGKYIGLLKECVPNVEIRQNGLMQFNFTWSVDFADDSYSVTKRPDTDNFNMYVSDNLGMRYDHVEVGGAAAQSVVMVDDVPVKGWFLFLPAQFDAKLFAFHDDDQGLLLDNIALK